MHLELMTKKLSGKGIFINSGYELMDMFVNVRREG